MTAAGRRAPRAYVLALVAVGAVMAAVLVLVSGGPTSSVTSRGARVSRLAHPAAPATAPHRTAAAHRATPHAACAERTARYGGFPSWLPKATVPVGRVVRASAVHPALAIQGDTVAVHLHDGQTKATVVGPAVPEEGKFPVPATSPCRFSISLAAGHGVVPIRVRDFSILDEQGHLHYPRVRLQGAGRLPARLAPGRIVTLSASAVLPTGNGRLRWAPNGPRPLASWDFDVEID
jgi:hypothetical protein